MAVSISSPVTQLAQTALRCRRAIRVASQLKDALHDAVKPVDQGLEQVLAHLSATPMDAQCASGWNILRSHTCQNLRMSSDRPRETRTKVSRVG